VTPDARAARDRKQKIFVVVGGLFLVALLAFQVPKLLGGSSSPEAAATTTETSALPGQVTPPPTGTATPTTPASSPTMVAATAKLGSLSFFKPKDPFVQQVKTPGAAGATGPTNGGGAAKTSTAKASPEKFSTTSKAAASATIVTVNGARQVLEPGMRFPTSDPLFVLVAEKPDAKAIVVGIVGGSYSGGDKTTTLKVGKPVTLVNTTTGARYKISLVSVGSGEEPAPAQAKQ
jgi:hypothetical protein